MKITFKIPYRTDPDTSIAVVGTLPQLGGGDTGRALQLAFRQTHGIWVGDISLTLEGRDPFKYRYIITGKNREFLHQEGGKGRIFSPYDFSGCETTELRDFWINEDNVDDVFETAPFKEVIFKRVPEDHSRKGDTCDQSGIFVRIRVEAPCVPQGQLLYLTGDIPAMGGWNLRKALPMRPGIYPFWEADLYVDPEEPPFYYKYAVGDASGDFITWESGDNRRFSQLSSDTSAIGQTVIVSDWPFQNPGGSWKGAGVAIPVFSIRTKNGLGVGEFSDLKLLADWAKQTGLRMIQI
ncbi:MAG: carbohydrate-binding module family 20 domain-containing protein, partial [Syntrophales bacterium]|nr:carbohydrate-binding module family 20 domain-containing protein [Syntrophales bacterium]